MASQNVSPPSQAARPPLVVEEEATRSSARYVRDFTIGRDATCTLTLDSGLVSRVHARGLFRDGRWRIEDLDSTNGLYVDGTRVDSVVLDGPTTLQFGLSGPRLHLRPAPAEAGARPATSADRPSPTLDDPLETAAASRPSARSDSASGEASPLSSAPSASPSDGSPPRSSVTAYLEYYFLSDDTSAGEHTRLLRRAYERARHTERRRFLMVVGAVLGVCLLLAGVALWQYQERAQLEGLAEEVFLDIKRQDLALAQLRLSIDDERPLSEQLAQRERERRMLAARYGGYVQELGLHRRLSAEEQIIHSVARIFGESEFSMPAGFVREVRSTIHDYWLGPGRARYEQAVRRAQDNGYVEPIVREMMARGLPPEFFYLALQESDFRADAVGPRTRWGIAKGMWQFIPSTGRAYGLTIGPREGDRVVDASDDRHDVPRATAAAARYLQTIYTTDAQASGLLVIASYNWGEHRVTRKLNRMNDAVPDALPVPGIPPSAFEGMDEDPGARNYWRFLTEYRDRMPDETRAYVLRVFAAAVIGQNPRYFGFDFDNPLQAAIEAVDAHSPAPSTGASSSSTSSSSTAPVS